MQAGNYDVVLDACVLANIAVCDLFLRLAETPRVFNPRWTSSILDEAERTQVSRLGWKAELAESFRRALETQFPEALVRDYEPLIAVVSNDAKDRHVLAAAIKAHASAIVTFNLRHFPREALARWEVDAVHPSEYLLALYSISPENVIRRICDIAGKRGTTKRAVLERLQRSCPTFAERLLRDVG